MKLISIGILSMVILAAQTQNVRAVLEPEQSRKPAPDFELKDIEGKTIKLRDYRGKVLLLNFWATYCGGCKVELPWFQTFDTSLRRRGFAALGVSLDEGGAPVVKPFLDKANLTFRMALAGKTTPDDYGITSMPATFLIDRQGRIAARYVGLVDRADIEANINSLLANRTATGRERGTSLL
jgi:cytochrome c biogenesis protein CcmG/thiol:disulfide interchange protein DsbE